jgi:UDP-hydrolysing UDP-N-acetyl-D-glucosamine 2-epimerase
MRRIGFLTSGRWDYSYLKSVFEDLDRAGYNCAWYVISENDSEFSNEMAQLYLEKSIDVRIGDFSVNREQLAVATSEMQAQLLKKVGQLDYAVLLGDRAEIFAGASVLFNLDIPFAHIAAGDRTKGAIDDNYRFAISSLADTHFAFSMESFETVTSTQLNSRGIFLTHPPQYSRMIFESNSTVEELSRIIDFNANQHFVLSTFHVETKSQMPLLSQITYIRDLIEEITSFTNVVITSPNGDPGSQEMLAMLEEVAISNPKVRLFSQLGEPNYWKVLRAAACIVGNSSSGVYEAPLFGVPVVNIGRRQEGRIPATVKLDFDWGEYSPSEAATVIKGLILNQDGINSTVDHLSIGEKLTSGLIWRLEQLEE